MLTKENILKADDLKTETVKVPEWGGSVVIKEMTGSERDTFEQATYHKNGSDYEVNMKDMRARLCAICMVDDKGERLFTDADVSALSGKSAKALDRVFSRSQKLNAISSKDVEELAKNSEATQIGSSTSS